MGEDEKPRIQDDFSQLGFLDGRRHSAHADDIPCLNKRSFLRGTESVKKHTV